MPRIKRPKRDRISSLPADLKAEILNLLPIKDAVRTSVLSTAWKDVWKLTSDLDIEDSKFASPAALVSSVDDLLLRRTAPIRKISIMLTRTTWAVFQALDRWMVILSRNKIEDVRFLVHNYYYIPSIFFTCVNLKKLDLFGCDIKLPPNFKGFELLTSLTLDGSFGRGSDLEKLICSCPMLKSLRVHHIDNIGNLSICAPNLHQLDILGDIMELNLQTPRLVEMRIVLIPDLEYLLEYLERTMHHGESFFKGLFGHCLHSITRVELNTLSMRYLGFRYLQDKRFESFAILKDVTVEICPTCPLQTAAALCLFQNAQNIEMLKIQFSCGDDLVAESSACSFEECSFPLLKILKTVGLNGREEELAILKCMLLTSPSLRNVCIIDAQVELPTYSKTVLEFPRSSTKAEIIFGSFMTWDEDLYF